MFELGGKYANRIGNYEVLEINEPKMLVKYDDGTTAELNMNIQYRIWENIVAEEEIKISRTQRRKSAGGAGSTRFFIRPVNSLVAEQLTERSWKEHTLISDLPAIKLNLGDRLIYFSIESQVFFAVATITGQPAPPSKKDKLPEKHSEESVLLFPLDIDAQAAKLEQAVTLDEIEFESQPKIKMLVLQEGTYIEITEDEFELLAELLTESTEEDEEEEEEEEEEEYED